MEHLVRLSGLMPLFHLAAEEKAQLEAATKVILDELAKRHTTRERQDETSFHRMSGIARISSTMSTWPRVRACISIRRSVPTPASCCTVDPSCRRKGHECDHEMRAVVVLSTSFASPHFTNSTGRPAFFHALYPSLRISTSLKPRVASRWAACLARPPSAQ